MRKACRNLGFDLLLVHFDLLPTMCRVRFGLTGIHFDSLEPNRPRGEFFQPLIAAVPSVAQNKQGSVMSEAIDCGAIEEKGVTATESSQNGITTDHSDLSSSSTDREGCRLAENAKTNRATVGSKRARDFILPSSPSSSSSSSASSPPSSDKNKAHRSANSKISFQPSKPPKPVTLRTTQKCTNKSSKRHTSTTPGRLTKAHPAKRVRFAMNVQERFIPSGDASEHSSDDSYTDPPSPTEPYDAFAGYYRTPGASRSHRTNGRIAGSKMRCPVEEEPSTDGIDGFFDSEDGSEVDVQGLPVRARHARTVRAAGKGRSSDQQRQHRKTSTLAQSKHPGKFMDQSQIMASGLESNADRGLHLEQSHASQKQPVSPVRLGGQIRYPKLRSGKSLPEPIFVVRPRFLSDARHKWKPADILSSSGYSSGISKNGHEGTKTPPPRPTRVNAPNKNNPPRYRPPLVSDDLKTGAEFDEDLGLLVRDV